MYGGSKDHLVWRLVDSRQDRSYGLFSVRINRSRSPRTGNIHEFQVLDSPDWVAVIPVTSADELVMVRQYRHGTASLSLEPPGGLVKHGSTPEQSGREELEEETGYQAAGFELLGCMDPMPRCLPTAISYSWREMQFPPAASTPMRPKTWKPFSSRLRASKR